MKHLYKYDEGGQSLQVTTMGEKLKSDLLSDCCGIRCCNESPDMTLLRGIPRGLAVSSWGSGGRIGALVNRPHN